MEHGGLGVELVIFLINRSLFDDVDIFLFSHCFKVASVNIHGRIRVYPLHSRLASFTFVHVFRSTC